MSLLNVWFCAGLSLALFQLGQQFCTKGNPNECKDAEFAPGTNLAGEGYDITKMQRKGAFVIDMSRWKHKDKTCELCTNPYLEGKRQKLPLSVVDWRPTHSCSMKVSSKLHRSSESLVSSTTSEVENNWRANLDVTTSRMSGSLMMAGTDSKAAQYSMEKTKNDKFSFTSHGMSCEYYSYRVSGTPKLHSEFRNAVKKLPKIYSPAYKPRFISLIDNFGTHYITKVKLGGSVKSITSIRQCQASLQGLSTEDIKMCLDVEASASLGGKAQMKSETKHCQTDIQKTESKNSFSSLFNDRLTEIKGGHTTEPDLLFSADKDPSAYKEWLGTLSQQPDIVSYSLEALHVLLPENSDVRKNLRSAISHYILEKALWKNCSKPCPVGVKTNPNEPCVCGCHNDPAVSPDCCPTKTSMARVVITVQRGSGLWGDHTTATDGFVKVSFNGGMHQRSRVIFNNNNPIWSMTYDLGSQDLSSGKKVRFEVWDEDSGWDDDLLGECERVVTAGAKEDICVLQHGRLYFKWEVTCAPNLGGQLCENYVSSPMSEQLQEVYVSRHARPVPKDILREMDVFVD